MTGLMHSSTAAGAQGHDGPFSGLYLLARLWPESRDFSQFVSLLPDDLPEEIICNVRHRDSLTCCF